MISDAAYIGARLSWKGILWFGGISFVILYFIIPAWLSSILQEQQNNIFYPMLETVFARRLHWLKWVAIAIGLVSIYFSVRNYSNQRCAGREERGLVGWLARLIGRSLD
jgi:uncharacterized membrane protein